MVLSVGTTPTLNPAALTLQWQELQGTEAANSWVDHDDRVERQCLVRELSETPLCHRHEDRLERPRVDYPLAQQSLRRRSPTSPLLAVRISIARVVTIVSAEKPFSEIHKRVRIVRM